MEYDLFRNNVQQVKAKKPILFALETDTPPSIDKIEDFEKIYRMVLPEKYKLFIICLLYTSPSPRDRTRSRMPSSA